MMRYSALKPYVARKVLFPSNVFADIQGIKELALWISCEPEKTIVQENSRVTAGTLYLIESYFEYDSPFMQAFLGYSAFEYMMMITVRNQKPMMAKQLRQKQVPEWARSFALDPFNYLETLKAQISAPR
jgi:hypothetical protein